ncbi:hypothetical protein [Prevotella veroralis]|uniref:hypothetical protein n=1 Tax=Prevotella veroralis TaxID=28137 RepID=UPI00055DEA7E|nr:hypothetical protein [Prevotella veroralis]
MTKKSIYFGTLLLTALAFGSCASDDTATDKTAGKDTPKTGTVFSSEDEPSTEHQPLTLVAVSISIGQQTIRFG